MLLCDGSLSGRICAMDAAHTHRERTCSITSLYAERAGPHRLLRPHGDKGIASTRRRLGAGPGQALQLIGAIDS